MKEKDLLAKNLLGHLTILSQAGCQWLPQQSPLSKSAPQAFPKDDSSSGLVPGESLAVCEPAPVENTQERLASLTLLGETVSKCVACAELARTRKQTVFGVGRIDPEVCFVGEAPGVAEDEQGVPFVGEAGQLLDKIIVAMGLQKADLYFCNIIKCHPPGERLPHPMEAEKCRGFLEAQLELVRPKVIVCLGMCAAQNLLGSKNPISKLRGGLHKWHEIPVICTFHPADLIRNPEKKRDVWEDMKKVVAYLGRSLPAK